jgi:hypothetical protein
MTHSLAEQQVINDSITRGEMHVIPELVGDTWGKISPLPKNSTFNKVLVNNTTYRRGGGFTSPNQEYILIYENRKKYLLINTSIWQAKFELKKNRVKRATDK